jgi:hypothetical protein
MPVISLLVAFQYAKADSTTRLEQPGPHSQRILTQESDAKGRSQTKTVVQIETGLNYLDESGEWVPSEAVIENYPEGARAFKGQHKASFAGNLNIQGAIRLTLPDGRRLVSHVLGLAYFDNSTGESVLFAPIQDCEGWIHPPNQVIYLSAFEGIRADVRYLYTKSGFEQDIVLRQAPPSPRDFGLDPATTQMEVWTEFVEAPEPVVVDAARTGIGHPSQKEATVDADLDFGSLQIGRGRAFAIGEEDQSLALVSKNWIKSDGRRFLVEAVLVDSVASKLDELPPSKADGAATRKVQRDRMQAMLSLPVRGKASMSGANGKMGTLGDEKMVAFNASPGLVLDYSSVIASLTNYTFRSDTTYYVSGATTLYGTNTTFEGGTVIKYAATNTPKLVVTTPVTCSTDLYKPVVLTAKDDKSVGETIGTNAISGYYADTALELQAGTNITFSIGNLRIAHAKRAIVLSQRSGHVLSHIQITNCQNGILPTSTSFSLLNALFANVLTNFNGSSATSQVEHLTVDTASWLNYNSTFGTGKLTLVNSLLVGVTNLGAYSGLSTITSSSPSTVFQSAGGGSRYLSSSSTLRDASTNSINAALTNAFRYCTTYPPRFWTNSVTMNTTIVPVVWRDTDIPDLGYHYPAIDYLSGTLSVTNSTLTISDGVVMAFTGTSWIWTQSTGALVSQGKPDRLNLFVRYSAVQEGTASGASTPSSNDVLVNAYSATGTTNAPSVSLRFTASHMPTPGGYHLYGDGSWIYSSVSARDTIFHDGSIWIVSDSANVSLQNDAQWRTSVWIEGGLTLAAYNQLNLNGYFDLWATISSNKWIVRDSAFDNCNVSSLGYTFTNSQNAYIGSVSVLSPTSSTNILMTTFTYAGSTLGPWYHGQTNLLNKGSRGADNAGLFHFTTQALQTRETNSVVDIGFHYVSTATNGSPLDSDSDGIWDFQEDENGDGTIGSGETDWMSATDQGLKVFIFQPQAKSNLY